MKRPLQRSHFRSLGILVLVGLVLPILSAGLLVFDCFGYHAPNRPPHLLTWGFLLLVGLGFAVVGEQLTSGRLEGIKARGWRGLAEVVHIRLAYASVVFAGGAVKFAFAGRSVRTYPGDALIIASVLILVSRLLAKYALPPRPRGGIHEMPSG